jgi:small GTP-binding protein
MEGVAQRPPVVLKAKICLVGDEAVGKTSLIHRFVHGVFDETYIRTLGAIPSKKAIDLVDASGRPIHLDLAVLDIMGKLTFLELFQEAYFRGARGILAVADITRRRTLQNLVTWIASVEATSGSLPTVIVVNKADLTADAEYGPPEIEEVARASGSEYYLTSAKSGAHVEDAFRRLAGLVAERSLEIR